MTVEPPVEVVAGLERAWARRMEEYAAPGLFRGCCPVCGGAARLERVGSAVFVRAPGVAAPAEFTHPAVDGWHPE